MTTSEDPRRMKSDQVNKNWAETLRRVREGGIVIIEHYKRAIAQMIPDDDTIVVLRVSDPGQAERLRRLVTEHGAVGIPFPNNATPGWRVVDEHGEPVNPHSILSVAAKLIPEEPAMEHFTAWLTTDPGALDQACADVVVLRDELRGEADDPNAWTSTGDERFSAATTVDAKDGDHEDAQREAEELLEAAGWKLDGKWEATDTGYIVTVTHA